MLNPTQPGEERITTALLWMREIDRAFDSIREEYPEFYAKRACSFELMLHRQLHYLRTYDNAKGVCVSLHPDSIRGTDLNLSLIWATAGAGPFMTGLLHWSGPVPGTPLTLALFTEAATWEWSVHT